MRFNIEDLLLNLSNFCLGRCTYCSLHKLNGYSYDNEITIKDIEKLLTDPYLDNLKNIHNTGGEVILSPKLWETCLLIKEHHPDIRLNMPVSGFFPYVTYRYVKKIHDILPQLRIDISVDGTTREIHEKTRGPGSWEPLNKTIELLKSIDGLNIQFQLTLMESNVEQIIPIQKWACSLEMGTYICFPRYGTRFGHDKNISHEHNEEFIKKVDEQIKKWCSIRLLNKRIWEEQKAIWSGKETYSDCMMGRESLDVDPFGNVYSCMMYDPNLMFGNIKFQTLTEMLESKQGNKVLSRIGKKECQPCPMPVGSRKKNLLIDENPYKGENI